MMICPYCKTEAVWVENKEIYGRNYGKSYMIWMCPNCKAFVGCHNNSKKPYGTMANKELHEWRKKAHAVIDVLWKSGKRHRGSIYNQMKEHFGFEVYIGSSDIEMCKKIIELFNQLN